VAARCNAARAMAGSNDNDGAAHDGTTRRARIIIVAGQSSQRTREVLNTLRGFTNVIWPPSLEAARAQTGSKDVACLVIADDLHEEPIDEFLQEAIYIASPELYQELQKWLATDSENQKLASALYRYLLRCYVRKR